MLIYGHFSRQTFIFAPIKSENRKIMRYLITFLTVCLISIAISAQNSDKLSIKRVSSGMDVFTDIWQVKPKTIDFRTINQGINAYVMYNFPVPKSDISLAIGLGIGSHNMYMKGIIKTDAKNISGFYPVTGSTTGKPVSYDKSKLNLTYFDIPWEIRYKTKEEFRVAMGFKVGFLISDHTKYKGNSYDPENFKHVKEKSADIENIDDIRYGFTALVGYKWVNMIFYYSLSKVFVPGRGPEVYPISIGLALRPY
jgi:hypothetical protein